MGIKSSERIKKTKSELKQDLIDQISLLRNSCASFDSGHEVSAIDMSIRLRVLFYEWKCNRSLLEQLGIRDKRYYDSAGPLDPKNLLPEMPMVSHAWVNDVHFYKPILSDSLRPIKARPFHEWWTQPILKDKNRKTMSRMDIVLNVADTDGGAHIDTGLEKTYHAMTRGSSMEFFIITNEKGRIEISNRLERVLLRQISFEALMSVERHAPYVCTP